MKKSSKFLAVAIAAIMTIGSIAFISCNKEKENNYSNERYIANDNASKTITLSDVQRLNYAQLLATKMSLHPYSYKELNYAISVVNSYGVDEHLAFFDVLSTSVSKFLLPNTPLSDLRSALTETGIVSDCGLTPENYYGNLQLYWPYHDNWDDTTTPVIIFIPVDENATTVTGYRCYPGGTATPIQIDESSITKDNVPCIIINEGEFGYNEYPNFRGGERSCNDITWGRTNDSSIVDPYINTVQPGYDTTTRALSYKFLNSGHQFDNWLAGGSEFLVTLARLNEIGSYDTVRYAIEMTREEIDNRTPADIEMIFYHDWKRAYKNIYYYFVEHDDWGFRTTVDADLTLGNSTISAHLTISTTDDFIAADFIPRYDYITKCQLGYNNYLWGQEKFFIRTIEY